MSYHFRPSLVYVYFENRYYTIREILPQFLESPLRVGMAVGLSSYSFTRRVISFVFGNNAAPTYIDQLRTNRGEQVMKLSNPVGDMTSKSAIQFAYRPSWFSISPSRRRHLVDQSDGFFHIFEVVRI